MDSVRHWSGILLPFALLTPVVLVRLTLLGDFPQVAPDEGGWPLSVRQWVEDGHRTMDYYLTPAFHWQLGGPFAMFGATLTVGRTSAAVAGLIGLVFFHGIACLTLRDRRQALWATVLLGTSYAAVMVDRRALIEPFQVAWMLALTYYALRGRRRDALWVAFCAAGLLLTKASGIFLLPALALTALWPRPAGPRWSVPIALAAGAAVAGIVFFFLHADNPMLFEAAWHDNLHHADPDSSLQGGRFGVEPLKVLETLRWLGEAEPLLFGLGIAGLFKALFERRHLAMAAWLVGGLLFLLVQVYVQANHRVVVVPALAFLAAGFVLDLERGAAALSVAGRRLTWPIAVLVVVCGMSLLRLGAGIAGMRDPAAPAVAWLRPHLGPDDRVAAGPYILMQLPSQPVSFAWFGEPYLPTPEQVGPRGIDWLVVDRRDWRHHVRVGGGSDAQLADALARCCDVAHETEEATIYRVRPPSSPPSPMTHLID